MSESKAAPYFNDAERGVARKLIRAIRKRGYTIRHSDGEDLTDCAKMTEGEIMALLSHTEQDSLSVHDAQGSRIGGFALIGQGPQADGEELIADYSWRGAEEGSPNEVVMTTIWNEVVNLK
ncbi:hypothetical protein AD951_08295 [Acetobacter malorum]|uniref:Uncharacterized protein n=1 Tax=Acetobacter malorum TaxID=178901 RepID=A0A149UM36_9PROT|nr:hypothetical protein [Acetobacter malorum]KXV69031.1 hypothetical protein AD951_08295 [Acetobacter malorum]